MPSWTTRPARPFITGKLARAILGSAVDDDVVEGLAKDFAASGLQIRPARASRSSKRASTVPSSTMVMAPVPWVVAAGRAAGVDAGDLRRRCSVGLRNAGQVPMSAPNVGGWPGGRGLADVVDDARPGRPGRRASRRGHRLTTRPARRPRPATSTALADRLGRPDGFIPATTAALGALHASGDRGVGVLAAALCSPDLVTG